MGTEIFVGQDYAVVSAAGVVKARAGKLARIIVTVAGSAGALQVNDNASAASGNVIFAAPGTAAQGTIYDVLVRAKAGIFVTPGTGQTVVVTFS